MLKENKSIEARVNKLHGKYINDTITPQELKEFISISMAHRGNVSMKEFGNRFRNFKTTKPVEAHEHNNINGELYDAFTNLTTARQSTEII
jgi:hypothetical protein